MASSSSDSAIPPTPATRGSTAPSLASFARRHAELTAAEPALLEPPPFADGSSSALPPGVRAHVAALHELLRELEAAGESWVREIAELRADPPPPPPSHLAPPAAYKMIATQSSTIEDLKARAEVSRAQIGGLVYEKGRLNQQLRDANSQLERRAEEKTAMVTALGEALKRATAEKDALLKSGKIAPETDAAEKSRLAQIVKSQQRTISTLRDELARARGGGGVGGGGGGGDGGGDGGAGTPATASRPPPAAAARPPAPGAARVAHGDDAQRGTSEAARLRRELDAAREQLAASELRAQADRASMATELGVVRAAAAAATKQADELRSELHRLRDAHASLKESRRQLELRLEQGWAAPPPTPPPPPPPPVAPTPATPAAHHAQRRRRHDHHAVDIRMEALSDWAPRPPSGWALYLFRYIASVVTGGRSRGSKLVSV